MIELPQCVSHQYLPKLTHVIKLALPSSVAAAYLPTHEVGHARRNIALGPMGLALRGLALLDADVVQLLLHFH